MSMRERLFEIVVVDYSNRNNGKYNTILRSNGRGKEKVDIYSPVPSRTLLKRARDSKMAMRWGRRFGTVISCTKVDTSYYLKNIEYLNLAEKVISVEVDREEFIVTKALELSRPKKEFRDKKYDIEVIDR